MLRSCALVDRQLVIQNVQTYILHHFSFIFAFSSLPGSYYYHRLHCSIMIFLRSLCLVFDAGIPAIVARSMMMKSNSDSIYLPLVARTIQSSDSARSATSSEGADFLIVNTGTGDFSSIFSGTGAQHVKIPIFFTLNDLQSEGSYSDTTSKLFQSGASGIVLSLAGIQHLTDNIIERDFLKVDSTDRVPQVTYSSASALEETNNVMVLTREKTKVAGFTKLDEKVMQLIATEKPILSEAVDVIRKAAPMVII